MSVQDQVFKKAGIKRSTSASYFNPDEDFKLDAPSADSIDTSPFLETPLSDAVTPNLAQKPFFDFDLGEMDLGGTAALAKGIGSIWDAYNKKEYQDEMVGMEKARVAREVDKQKKAQAALDKAWA